MEVFIFIICIAFFIMCGLWAIEVRENRELTRYNRRLERLLLNNEGKDNDQ